MKSAMGRQLRYLLICFVLQAAGREFWQAKDPSGWSPEEKQVLLNESPWARAGFAKMEEDKPRRTTLGYGNNGRPGGDMPDTRPGVPPGGVRSVPIGEEIPKAPRADPGKPLQFPVMARWETAKPVRMAGGPEVPELTGQYYVIRLRGLPLMPPAKVSQGETAPDPNEGMLAAIKAGSRLERKGKAEIPCDHLFKGSGEAATEVLLFFRRGVDSITAADKVVTLESQFGVFHLSIKFPLKDMIYKGELAL